MRNHGQIFIKLCDSSYNNFNESLLEKFVYNENGNYSKIRYYHFVLCIICKLYSKYITLRIDQDGFKSMSIKFL